MVDLMADQTTGGLLVIIRHGESISNASGTFTGLLDPPLSAKGVKEATALGPFLESHNLTPFDQTYTSPLQRAFHSLELILSSTQQNPRPPIQVDAALNERDYGDLNGRSKLEVAQEVGEELTNRWRRGYREVPPDGESLEMCANRVWAWYQREVVPRLRRGERILIVSHGNTLRALVKKLEGLDEDQIMKIELGTAAIRCYAFDSDGKIADKRIYLRDGREGSFS